VTSASTVQRQFTTASGVVVARCTGPQAYLISWSPAPGFHTDDVNRGPATSASVTFVNGPQQVDVRVHCLAGVPQVVVRTDD
jgi:hypothetical protein